MVMTICLTQFYSMNEIFMPASWVVELFSVVTGACITDEMRWEHENLMYIHSIPELLIG